MINDPPPTSAEPAPPWERTYLGDGCYLSHDGWQIWLAANHPSNPVIAIDPAVFGSLLECVLRHPGHHRDVLLRTIERHNRIREETRDDTATG